MIFKFLLPQVPVYQIKYCENVYSLRVKESYSNLQKTGLWTKRIDANRLDNSSLTYLIVSLARFLHRLRPSPEKKKPAGVATISKTET